MLVAKSSENARAEFYRLPNDEYAIPGSSLRGMIRNVLEIISFGKMKNVDNKRYGVRDLYSSFYQEKLSKEIANKEYKSQTRAGFLKFIDGKWAVTTCDYARIEHQLLEKQLRRTRLRGLDVNTKYQRWLSSEKNLNTNFSHGGEVPYNHDKQMKNGRMRELVLHYKKVTALKGSLEGSVVFTGAMQNKHMEFVFFNRSTTIELNESVIQGFLGIYKESDHWKVLQNLEKANNFPNGIPVFYLLNENNDIASLGLSQMYKLAYTNSITDMIKHTSPQHLENNHLDLAELIFGTLDDDNGKQSLKSRVSFSIATCDKKYNAVSIFSKQAILNSPKPTYYPNYIKQEVREGRLVGSQYQTYMDKAKLRGWKRYPVQPKENIPELTKEQRQKTDIQINLNPIEASQEKPISFNGKVRFHNLKHAELGALIWALTWGDDDTLYHSLGMGKSFGLGRVQVNIEDMDIIANNTSKTPTSQDCLNTFISTMNQAYKNCFPSNQYSWELSPNMLTLTAMANPEMAKNKTLKHMDLQSFSDARHMDRRWVLGQYINIDKERNNFEKKLKEKRSKQKEIEKETQRNQQIQKDKEKKQNDKNNYIERFEVQENGERLYKLFQKIEEYEKALISKDEIAKHITPAVKVLLKTCSSWSDIDKSETITVLDKAISLKGLYKPNKRKKLKSDLKKL